MSATLQSAEMARDQFKKAPVHIVDSESVSLGLGMMAMEAAKAAQSGADAQKVLQIVEKIRQSINVIFTVDTLEYLYKGGRIGGATAFLGSTLNIKPILSVVNGDIVAAERVRTMKHALTRVVDLVDKRVASSVKITLAGLYADIPEMGENLLDLAVKRIGTERIHHSFIATISPALGIHIGPGSVGLAYMWE